MQCTTDRVITNELKMMIRQGAISAKLGERDAVVMDFPGVDEGAWQRIRLISDPADPEPCAREWAREIVHTLNKSQDL